MRPAAPVPHLTHPKLVRAPRTRVGRAVRDVLAVLTAPFLVVAAFAQLVAAMSSMTVGVQVMTAARAGSGTPLRAVGSRYFAAGLAEKGDAASPVRVSSMQDYVREFGNRVSYGFLSDDLQAYFEEGGTEAIVTRVVGAGATKGTKQLVDRNGGGAVNTILLTALSAGAWSANVTVTVSDGVIANTFTIALAYKAGTVDEITETYKDLPDPATAVAQINGRSRLVVATNSGSVTGAPLNNPKTDQGGGAAVAVALSAGTDDLGTANAAALVAALARFTPAYGPGAVAIPGYDASLVAAGIKAHCKAAGMLRVGLNHDVAGSSIAAGKALAATMYGTADAEFYELCGPWVKIPDGVGGNRTVPPTGFVAGRRAAAHQKSGPWLWPAGEQGRASFVVGTEFDVDAANTSALVDAGFNPIRNLVGAGVELYGWRSLSSNPAYYSLAARDTLNVLAWAAEQALEPYVYKPIDSKGVTVAGVRSELVAICEEMKASGGLFARVDGSGAEIDPGYSVAVVANAATRTITATVAVRVVEAAELIVVSITKVAPDQAV